MAAIQCHYFNRAAYRTNQGLNDLSKNEELLLAEDDLLLIGDVLRPNPNCDYRLGHFANDHAHELGTLGTMPAAWRTDSRGLALGISRIFGVTVYGTIYLILQTSLKQRILDKQTNHPSRANPQILNHYYGVQISHCAYSHACGYQTA